MQIDTGTSYSNLGHVEQIPTEEITGGSNENADEGMLFSQIKDNGLDNACYVDEDHYVAEYLYQNPEVCFWSVDSDNQKVIPQATPTPPDDAIHLPPPSGGNDTLALESVINANRGKSVVGSGVYIVSNLNIAVPIDIYNMPMVPARYARDIVQVNAPDVRIFNSPIDGQNSNTARNGFSVNNGSHRFTLVNSGYSNVYQKHGQSYAGVKLKGVDDFHIACNTFDNLINTTNASYKTARANSIWMNGSQTQSTSGGYIVNNNASNHQSNGKNKDAEFFTVQSYVSTAPDNPVRIFANRTVDAGKRFTKHQESDALVLSNDHKWLAKEGPLGNRTLLTHVGVQFSNNVIARNNRVNIGAGSRFAYVFSTAVNHGYKVQSNIHYDCNDIEITDNLSPASGNSPRIFTARMSTRGVYSTGYEAIDSSASYNYIHGQGSVNYYYWFGEGYAANGGKFETKGNIFEIPYLKTEYKNP